jgi:hypothetical protein
MYPDLPNLKPDIVTAHATEMTTLKFPLTENVSSLSITALHQLYLLNNLD